MDNIAIIVILCCYLSTIPVFISSYTPPINNGLEIRVCMDKDCQLDGSKQTLKLVQSLTPTSTSDNDNQIVVEKCGCLGPCGSGPTIDFRRDGIRLKDTRDGMDNYFLFRKMNSKQAIVDMLRIGDIEPISKDTSTDIEAVTNTRQWYDIDRNQRIRIQQLLYAITGIPLFVAYKSGEWNESYAFVAVVVFVASQFMGTSKTSNAVVEDEED